MKNILELRQITLDDKYCKKWNIRQFDFLNLYKNGKRVNDTLYRVGGFGVDFKNNYIMILKQVETYYDDKITEVRDRKPHLESQWCIIDKNGIEKICFKPFEAPYLQGGRVYSLDNNYYDVETNKLYCNSYSAMSSEQFIFLNNKYDKDISKRGVMKINKSDGTYEMFI